MIVFWLISTLITALSVQFFYYIKLKQLEKKGESLLEEKVGDVLNAFKQEIPMGSTFLRGTLEEKLKQKALTLVRKIIPELKKRGGDYSFFIVPPLLGLLVGIASYYIYLNF